MSLLDNLYASTLGKHFDNTGNLRAAERQYLISEPQYKTMSGYDASQTIPGITDNPLVTGAASGAYNIAKSIISPEDYFDQNTYQKKIGPIDSTLLNIQGSIGLSPQDKEKYEGIVSLDPKSLGIGEWSEEDLTDFGGVYPVNRSRMRQQQLMNRRKQMQQQFMNRKKQMQQRIRQHEAAQQVQQVQQNIQTYENRDRPNTGMNVPGGGKGQSPTGGDVAGTPFVRGGIVDLYRHGGF